MPLLIKTGYNTLLILEKLTLILLPHPLELHVKQTLQLYKLNIAAKLQFKYIQQKQKSQKSNVRNKKFSQLRSLTFENRVHKTFGPKIRDFSQNK